MDTHREMSSHAMMKARTKMRKAFEVERNCWEDQVGVLREGAEEKGGSSTQLDVEEVESIRW